MQYPTPEYTSSPKKQQTYEVEDKLIQESHERFRVSLERIKTAKDPEIAAMAQRVEQRIAANEIGITFEAGATHPTPTELRLVEVEETKHQYVAGIVINIGKTIAGSARRTEQNDALTADLVRTLGIVDRFPFNGYEQRKQQVYADAIQMEERWLNSAGVHSIPSDPRKTAKDEIIRSLLGDEVYYADAGWDDFTKALENYRQLDNTPGTTEVIDSMLQNRGHFVAMREHFTPIMYQAATHVNETAFKNEDPNKRAEVIAYNLLGISLYGAGRG